MAKSTSNDNATKTEQAPKPRVTETSTTTELREGTKKGTETRGGSNHNNTDKR